MPGKRTLLAWNGMFIRKDWLDKLGMPLPTNRDELYETLVAFRDKNPGNVNGVIPWATAAAGMNYTFGNLVQSFWGQMSEEEFVTTPNWLKPGNKDAYKWLNKLYNEKLISPDFCPGQNHQAGGCRCHQRQGRLLCRQLGLSNDPENPCSTEAKLAGCPLCSGGYLQKNTEGKYLKEVYNENGIFSFIPKSSKKMRSWRSNI
ncbi:extracellular solute-binding protein [Paenibacillus rhizoplanae]